MYSSKLFFEGMKLVLHYIAILCIVSCPEMIKNIPVFFSLFFLDGDALVNTSS